MDFQYGQGMINLDEEVRVQKRWIFSTEANASDVRFFKTLQLDEARDVRSGAYVLGT